MTGKDWQDLDLGTSVYRVSPTSPLRVTSRTFKASLKERNIIHLAIECAEIANGSLSS